MTPSQLELARARKPGVPDVMLIEGLVEELSIHLDLTPPTNLHLAASYQQIKTISYGDIEWAGMLTPAQDGSLTITVRSSDGAHRQNFSIGHEIVHTLLPGYSVTQRRWLGCGGPPSKGSRSEVDEQWPLVSTHLERLADAGAAELLLPRRYLEPEFLQSPFTIPAVGQIAGAHHASLDATLRRLLHVSDRPAIVFDLRRTVSADFTPRNAIHRVFSNSDWCTVAPSQLRGMSLDAVHPLCEVFNVGALDDVLDLSFLPITTHRANVSAQTDPYIDNEGNLVMRALVLATPHHAMLRHELTASPRTRLVLAK